MLDNRRLKDQQWALENMLGCLHSRAAFASSPAVMWHYQCNKELSYVTLLKGGQEKLQSLLSLFQLLGSFERTLVLVSSQ